MSKATYTFVTLALLVMAGAASAAPVAVELEKHNQISSGGALSTLKWKTCSPTGATNPCLSTTNAWTLANATGSTAVWTWDAATGVLSMTGTFQSTSFVSSNANGSPVISDKVVDLVIDTTANTTTAASYNCIEGTFLASVGANGCLNTSLGDDFANSSSALYNVGGDPYCVQRTIGGDDASTGNTRGLATLTTPPCDPMDGGFNLWDIELDKTAVFDGSPTEGQLIIRTSTPITDPGANFLTFRALPPVPTAVDDSASGFQDTPLNIDVLANDTDFTDPVTVTKTDGTNGTVVVNGSGNQAAIDVTYTPNPGFSGTDTFTYTVVDANSATDTATVTVTIAALGANDDAATTRWNTPVTVDVLANDVGYVDPVTVTITTDGTSGSAVVNNGPTGNKADIDVTYTPAPNFVGIDTFTYTVSDGIAPDETATVTVTVTNEVPTAGPGTISISTAGFDPTTRSGPFNAATGNNLGDAPSGVTAAGATTGTTSVSGTTVTYIPNATFFQGSDTFSYTITDVDDETATNTVTVTIADVSPTLAAASITTTADTASAPRALTFTLGNGSAAQHTLAVTTQGGNGSCALSSTTPVAGAAVTYTPTTPGYTGGDSCVVTITDENGSGDAVTGTVTVTVNAASSGGGGGNGGLLPGGSGAFDPWSLAFLAGLPMLGRLRASRRRQAAGNQ